ncbi:hypothetical protein GH714_024553 [Hevea brasiliensis]|uniref:Major facilitator superfamily (MFS) profile domain-containing protein n=1 Tax=Hevea brasiliensis TaxID=3981 RepID=A0A6A6LR49_HEVBR|nr:hypothetical protein GH714_024553 [Hevea brasiliensis]
MFAHRPLASEKTSDYLGRPYTIVLAATTFLIGALLMGLAPSFHILMAGCVVAGIGIVSESAEEAEFRVVEITKAASSGSGQGGSSSTSWHGQGVWKELLLRSSPPVRRMLIAAIGLIFFMQASGNDAVIYYCPEVFKAAGIHSKKMLFGVNVTMGFAKTFGFG